MNQKHSRSENVVVRLMASRAWVLGFVLTTARQAPSAAATAPSLLSMQSSSWW